RNGAPRPRYNRPMLQLQAAKPSDHCDGARFFNPWLDAGTRGLGDFLRWRLSRKAPVWPRWIADENLPPPQAPGPGAVVVTYIAQATLLLRFAGFAVLTDPMFSPRASPFASL